MYIVKIDLISINCTKFENLIFLGNKKRNFIIFWFLAMINLCFSQNAIKDFNHKKINLDSISKVYELKKQIFTTSIPKEYYKYKKSIEKDYQYKIDNLKSFKSK